MQKKERLNNNIKHSFHVVPIPLLFRKASLHKMPLLSDGLSLKVYGGGGHLSANAGFANSKRDYRNEICMFSVTITDPIHCDKEILP
jgi:hypothetical protein